MSVRQQIADLLDQWLQLTQAEARAIQSSAWPSLKDIQSAKGSLQKRLTQVKERWETETSGKALGGPGKHLFFAEIGRLLSHETRNAELLAAKLRHAHAQRDSLNEAARNLRNVRQSYVLKPAGIWNRCS